MIFLLAVFIGFISHISAFSPQGDWILEIVVSLKHSYSPGSRCLYKSRLPLPLCFLIKGISGDCGGKRVTLWRILLGGQKLKLTPWDTFSLIHLSQTFHPVFLHSYVSLHVGAKLRDCNCDTGANQEIKESTKSPLNTNSGMAEGNLLIFVSAPVVPRVLCPFGSNGGAASGSPNRQLHPDLLGLGSFGYQPGKYHSLFSLRYPSWGSTHHVWCGARRTLIKCQLWRMMGSISASGLDQPLPALIPFLLDGAH